jgi:hypothetical protein
VPGNVGAGGFETTAGYGLIRVCNPTVKHSPSGVAQISVGYVAQAPVAEVVPAALFSHYSTTPQFVKVSYEFRLVLIRCSRENSHVELPSDRSRYFHKIECASSQLGKPRSDG